MNQQCKVCGEPAAGYHFGAFTCEGCKSFFGRSHNSTISIADCKNKGHCVINKKNRTSCKACRLRKCLSVGMSKSSSRYGRRSNWFKLHCLFDKNQENMEQKPSINLLFGVHDYKATSPSLSSPDSVSDSSETYRPIYKDVPQYIPYLFNPAYLPPYNGFLFASQCYDDNFNRTERPPTPDSPIDLSVKTSESTAPDDFSSEEDITVDDDLPMEDPFLRRTAPLDLSSKFFPIISSPVSGTNQCSPAYQYLRPSCSCSPGSTTEKDIFHWRMPTPESPGDLRMRTSQRYLDLDR